MRERTRVFHAFRRLARAGLPVLLLLSLMACRKSPSNPQPGPGPITGPSPTPTPTGTPIPPTGGTYDGPETTIVSEYRLPASNDDSVLSGARTEIWASVWRPVSLSSSNPRPLIMMLHGNHDTCGSGSPIVQRGTQYTVSGSCPAGTFVIPNHRGYDYLGQKLASWGYVVVSINANLGITGGAGVPGDSGLNLARGRLILRHLAWLSQWNRDGGEPAELGFGLQGTLDFNHVGLFGHSRGGEGIRAAYNLYRDGGSPWPGEIAAPVTFESLFEIGPTDGQTSRVLNATGAAWNALLPLCDGDLVTLPGRKPFDRMIADTSETPGIPKSLLAVWGANHDFYNTMWQDSDSTGCVGQTQLWQPGSSESIEERMTGVATIIPFFRAHLGTARDPGLAALFNPLSLLPSNLSNVTRVDRSYVPGTSALDIDRLENFSGADGHGSSGLPADAQNVTIHHLTPSGEDSFYKAGEVGWSAAGPDVFYQNNWSLLGGGVSLSGVESFDFRVARANNPANPAEATDFQIQFVYSDNSLGPAQQLSRYLTLVGPVGELDTTVGGTPTGPHLTSFLSTVRIPIRDLVPAGILRVRGVRFTFNSTSSGSLYFSDIGFGHNRGPVDYPNSAQTLLAHASSARSNTSRTVTSTAATAENPIRRIRRKGTSIDATGTAVAQLEIESTLPIHAHDSLPVLHIDGEAVSEGGASATGDPRFLTFSVPLDIVRAMRRGTRIEVVR